MRKMFLVLLMGIVALAACGKKEAPPKPAQPIPTEEAKPKPEEEAKPEPEEEAKPEPEEEAKPEPEEEAKPQPEEEAKPDPELIKKGAYIADVMMCGVCHTPMGPKGPDMAKAFAGGFEVPEEFGTWRSPNITPDKKTGIGSWTDEQIITSIREGKRPDGTLLYPIMPSMFFNVLSDDDAKALVAFLRSLPAVEHAVAGNTDLELPKMETPKPSGAEPPPEKRGEYLASLMHCAFCHTPMNMETGAPDMDKAWAGGFPMPIPEIFEPMMGKGTIYAANITADPETGIGKWTEEQIATALKEGKRPDGTMFRGAMGMISQMVVAKMTDDDVKALAGFVKGLPAVVNKVPEAEYTPPAGPPPGDEPHE